VPCDADLISRITTRTLNRDTALGLNFAAVMFHDAPGFMVRNALGVTNATELDGATVKEGVFSGATGHGRYILR